MVDNDAVTLAYVHDGESVAYSWYFSVLNLLMHDSGGARRFARGGFAQAKHGTGGIVAARENVVADWLANTDSGWLLWVDTDMGFAPDTLDRLFAVADPVSRPVVGALCFAQATGEGDGWGGFRPVMWPVVMRWVEDEPGKDRGFFPVLDYPRDQLVPAAATGSACILVHRGVFERLRELNGGGSWSQWYHPLPTPNGAPGAELSEDFSFCLRLREAGIPLHVHTGVKTTHLKPTWLCEDAYLVARAQQLVTVPVEAATEKVAVIVPVLNRPQNARPFMESLKASGSAADLCTVYAVVDDDDPETGQAWLAAGAVVLHVPNLVTFPRKANYGYRESNGEPWLFLVGDDVRFHPGWLDEAMQVARTTGANVVATNDLGNPRVVAGQHATHPLIRRAYVDGQGASWDGPGVLCHEAYRHWAVDSEWTTVAKQRGTFAAAPKSVVEHLHHYWKPDVELDDTYRLGESQAAQDMALFAERLEVNSRVAVAS